MEYNINTHNLFFCRILLNYKYFVLNKLYYQNYNFLSLLKYSVERRKKCIDACEYYKNCYSGCNANALLDNDNISCYIHKNILDEIKKYTLESRENLENMNSNYAKILSKKR